MHQSMQNWHGRGKIDEAVISDAAIQCFWAEGYEATSVRDLADEMGITGARNQNPRRANDSWTAEIGA
jgi:Bacterial regulatory proteins, tetR family